MNDNPNLTMDLAFKASAYEDVARQSRMTVKKGLRPITKDGNGKATKTKYNTVAEAARAAYESLKQKGLFSD
jgi:hypothetical protein